MTKYDQELLADDPSLMGKAKTERLKTTHARKMVATIGPNRQVIRRSRMFRRCKYIKDINEGRQQALA
jgi:hypothetical protein